ncbi:class I SAM-dependent methyltransferase [Candidatus Poribacteria bacterium]|nr:class I SAM-dependent methyltransferase [Candidatus Poribacteria bacterium]
MISFIRIPCPICQNDHSERLFTDINRREGLSISATLVECAKCGMRYLNPAPNAASLAQLYSNGSVDTVALNPVTVQPVSRTLAPVGHLWSIARSINGLLRGHPHDWPEESGKGHSILDFGCFDGSKLVYWYQRGWRVAGIDLNQQALQVAQRRFPDGRFWCGDLLELDIAERFDFIRSDNVVEHLLDPVAYLTALVKRLKPGGQLCVFVPNGAAFSARLLGRYSYVHWMPFHLNLFTPNTLRIALGQAGLTDSRCFTFSPIGSWTPTQRQILLRPGFNRRSPSILDRLLQRLSLLGYPGETIAQWLGMGEEVIGTGRYV